MAPSQPPATSSPHPGHTAGPSTISSSSTSPTETHSTLATTVGSGGNRQRSWNEDKNLNLYILDYCRRRKFDGTASAFAREANLPPDAKASFDAPQGLLFEWWIVFWETFNSQRSSLSAPPGQRESGQAYVNTMARLRKLAMHEKDEQNRARSMSMSMSTPGMPPMMGGMAPVMNGSGSASAMSTPAMGNMPNPMGPRPQSQASGRMGPQQPGTCLIRWDHDHRVRRAGEWALSNPEWASRASNQWVLPDNPGWVPSNKVQVWVQAK
ncbi:hypothetical protein RSAG8_08830, partial [Rhizoctonia solani AG-8 WAC10335]